MVTALFCWVQFLDNPSQIVGSNANTEHYSDYKSREGDRVHKKFTSPCMAEGLVVNMGMKCCLNRQANISQSIYM